MLRTRPKGHETLNWSSPKVYNSRRKRLETTTPRLFTIMKTLIPDSVTSEIGFRNVCQLETITQESWKTVITEFL